MKTLLLEITEAARPALSRTSEDYAESTWLALAKAFQKNPKLSLKEMTVAVSRGTTEKLLGGGEKGKYFFILRPLLKAVQEGTAQALAATFEKKAIASFSRGTPPPPALYELWHKDMAELLRKGLLTDIITAQIHAQFFHVFSMAKKTFLALLLPVFLEISATLYFRSRRRKKNNAGSLAT